MIRNAAFTVVVLIAALARASTTGKVMGLVTDPDGEALIGASVVIEGTTFGSMTDAAGEYYIPMLDPGEYTVTARMVGMGPVSKEGVTVVAGQSTRIDFQLRQEAAGQTVIQVTDQRNLILENVPSTIHVIDLDEIRLMSVAGILDVVGRQPGVVTRQGEIHVRGGRSGEVAYLLDGIPMRSPVMNTYGGGIPLSAVSETSITTGGLTAEHGNAMSGVVSMVTREGGPDYEAELHLRGGAMNELGGASESRNYSEPSENDSYRGDCYNAEAAVGGPEPITTFILPSMGIDFPGKTSFFAAGSFIRSGYDLEDSRGFWENNWQNGLAGSLKLTTRLDDGSKVSLMGHYTYRQSGWDEWQWSRYNQPVYIEGSAVLGGDPDYALPERLREDYGATVSYTGMLGEETFLDLRLNQNRFAHWRRIQSETGGYRGEGFTPADWLAGYLPEQRLQDSLGFYHQGVHPDVWLESQSYVSTMMASISSKLSADFELKAGIQGRYYDIYDYSVYDAGPGSIYLSLWEAFPYSGAAYVQTTSSFSGGLVVNAGLRYDHFDPNSRKFSLEESELVDISAKAQLSPRIGITHPVTERDVFFATFGHYFQMPNLNQMFFGTDYNLSGAYSIVGNPDLDAQRTEAYELGVRHRLSDLSSVAVSAFSKDITGLVRTREYESESYDYYFLYENDDSHGTVTGAEVKLLRLPGDVLSGSVGYTYSVARGRYSSPTEQFEYAQQGMTMEPTRDSYLDWDQRHTADAHVSVELGRGWGPRLAGVHPFERVGVTLDWMWGSGFPYSPPQGQTEQPQINTERYPYTMQTDLMVSRRFDLWTVRTELAVTVFNLFDRRNLNKIYDVEHYVETGEPGGAAQNPGAWSAARHALLRLSFFW